MSAPGPWTLCYTPPGGVRSCSYIPLVAEWPDVTDHPDPVILDQIGRLQTLASEVQEPTLKMQLTMALDAVVERVSTQLPAGFEFLREATHDSTCRTGSCPTSPARRGSPHSRPWPRPVTSSRSRARRPQTRTRGGSSSTRFRPAARSITRRER